MPKIKLHKLTPIEFQIKMAKPLIQITKIKRDFVLGNEIVYVLKGIDLEINKGEYVALMGPSGSGKSTLMNLLGCLDTPTSGSYILNGKDVSKMHDDELAEIRNKEIGFVFQTFNLLPRTTALENVALPMVYAGYSKTDRMIRAEEVLKQVGLADRMDHQPNQLSGGQQQRVALVRALAINPSLLLMDEPLSNLDRELRLNVRTEIVSLLKKLKITTLIVSHDTEDALAISDKIIIIEDGMISQVGSPLEVFNVPKSCHIASLFGQSNFIPFENLDKKFKHFILNEKNPHRDGFMLI